MSSLYKCKIFFHQIKFNSVKIIFKIYNFTVELSGYNSPLYVSKLLKACNM